MNSVFFGAVGGGGGVILINCVLDLEVIYCIVLCFSGMVGF